MRVFVAVSAALMLFGCNWVVTKAPLFGPADEAGAPQLRSGVWGASSSKDCAFDQRKPVADWPDCAGWLIVKNGRWMFAENKGRREWTVARVVLTAGSPQILQTPPELAGKGADATYSYYGLSAASRDKRGRITAFRMWPVLCGPPAPPAKAGDPAPAPAVHPFPGMTVDVNDSDCTTASREAVRQAADASQLWADTSLTARWIRDGDR
jgi:hypothetical protein